ncbi:hypothetical protein CLOSYM_04985 [[Clostridium] symbiosum ATCC 14940]|uniref:Uncharacterized protein n=1 Tax=[Clostridium] symbiosum ATCC 14940 TaxID=411472 RepID=A0ABC9TQ72_CLOSY|nr:hypothetical protein CLOSYM_04985 [[Clostridium] symbiosum ATCC 14940]
MRSMQVIVCCIEKGVPYASSGGPAKALFVISIKLRAADER